MKEVRGLTVCVEYDDILALTLPRNLRHLEECVVVTSRDDARTARVVRGVKGARLFQTDAFTRDGAHFNKGLAIEEAFDALGRSGWVLIWDADILMPEATDTGVLEVDVLYSAERRQLPEGVKKLEGDWAGYDLMGDCVGTGYFQLFHAGARAVAQRPWYSVESGHAGMSDWWFALKFEERRLLPFQVLHIGERGENWFGRATPRLDGTALPEAEARRVRMGELYLELGWTWARPDLQRLAEEARGGCAGDGGARETPD